MKNTDVVKGALVAAMDEFHRVCEENNLKYYLIGGSLIGAIRHKGCIPWDDDIDVAMLTSDFEKLLRLSSKFNKNFRLRHRKIDPLEPEPIIRIENRSVIIEEGYYSKARNGVFIDVFCLEETFNSSLLQNIHFKLSAFARILIRLKTKSYRRNKYSPLLFNIFKLSSIALKIIPKSFLNSLLEFTEKIGKIGGPKKYVANLHGAWKTKEIAPKVLFQHRSLYDFEGRQYWSIEDADAWLRPIYGDYMQLPPEEDRVPKHIEKIISINGVKVDS